MPNLTRRGVLGATLALALGSTSLLRPAGSLAASRSKRILILGGTGFVGPHDVRHALARGHEVTVFNRGNRPGLFGKDVEELTGDRGSNLDALKGRRWDAVIDESASTSVAPEWVKLTANLLRDSVDQYVFISSRAAYAHPSQVPMTSAAPTLTLENTPIPAGAPLPYGHAKAYAERAAEAAMPGRVTHMRAGLVVGPGDETDRFTYWPVRIARGGEVLAPGDGSEHVQIIDVRDLVEFNIHVIEQQTFGVFNIIGPHLGRRFDDYLRRIHEAVGGSGSYTWVDTEFLLAQGIRPNVDLPTWQLMRGRTAGWARFDLQPEIEAGLKHRPLEQTARDTLEWFRAQPGADPLRLKAGISPQREAELLALWKERTPAAG